MSIDVNVAAERVRVPLARAHVADLVRRTLRAERVRHALVSVTFLDRRAIAALNRRHLRHAGPTDVISFGFTRTGANDPVIGDVYISPEVARDNARERRISVRVEIARLVIHGVLHVLGHEHPVDEEREGSPMWRRQETLVRRLAARPR
jgi:probable rRNA maturation factor